MSDYGEHGPCMHVEADELPCDRPSVGAIGARPPGAWGYSAFAYCSEWHMTLLARSLRSAGWEVRERAVW
jgi:hypothetical protein